MREKQVVCDRGHREPAPEISDRRFVYLLWMRVSRLDGAGCSTRTEAMRGAELVCAGRSAKGRDVSVRRRIVNGASQRSGDGRLRSLALSAPAPTPTATESAAR
ncbi:MAG TPA: hypothetical protein DEP35_07950 [Deltaproteobacteria bacterium]|nr:hypothetical protein [Deltaproteobacteria bacterium]